MRTFIKGSNGIKLMNKISQYTKITILIHHILILFCDVLILHTCTCSAQEYRNNVEVTSPFHEQVTINNSINETKVVSEVIPIQFAKADELIGLIHDKSGLNLLSENGKIAVDKRTNSLLIQDTLTNIKNLKSFLPTIDIPIKQVEIEARIVTVSESKMDDLGVRWGLSFINDRVKISDTIEHNNGISTPHAGSIAVQIAELGSGILLDLELSALQAESVAKVISSPKIITTDKKTAYIEQGTEIPYLEASSNGATSVSFRKAVLSLEVTPQITANNQILLDLNVTQDRPGQAVKAGEGEAVAIDTQRLSTQVLVQNKKTLVLGGIYQYTVQKRTESVPFFSELPWIGKLFESHSQNNIKHELLIFVTPNIVNQFKTRKTVPT